MDGEISAVHFPEAGNGEDAPDLFESVYKDLRRVAAQMIRHNGDAHTLQATALVHEAWMRLVKDGSRTWENRNHFFCAAAEAMRRILIDRARRKAAVKHGSGQAPLDIADLEVAAALPDAKILLMDEALERLKAEDAETAQVVTLKFFGGLTNEEIAAITKSSESTVRRQWNYAKLWLYNCVQKHL